MLLKHCACGRASRSDLDLALKGFVALGFLPKAAQRQVQPSLAPGEEWVRLVSAWCGMKGGSSAAQL